MPRYSAESDLIQRLAPPSTSLSACDTFVSASPLFLQDVCRTPVGFVDSDLPQALSKPPSPSDFPLQFDDNALDIPTSYSLGGLLTPTSYDGFDDKSFAASKPFSAGLGSDGNSTSDPTEGLRLVGLDRRHTFESEVARVRSWLEDRGMAGSDSSHPSELLQRGVSPSARSSRSVSSSQPASTPYAHSVATADTMTTAFEYSRSWADDEINYETTRDTLQLPYSHSLSFASEQGEGDVGASTANLAPVARGRSSRGPHNLALPQRNYSNSKKRGQDSLDPESARTMLDADSSETSTSIAKRIINSNRPKSPRLYPAGALSPSQSPQSAGPWTAAANSSEGSASYLRSRSRSDVGLQPSNLQRDQSSLGVPGTGFAQGQWLDAGMTLDPEEDDLDLPYSNALWISDAPVDATSEAFAAHIRNLNPNLDSFLVERITEEQLKRHKRLVDFRSKHETAVARKACPSGARCSVLGEGPDYSLSSSVAKSAGDPPASFHVIQPDGSHEASGDDKGGSIPAAFPDGIPIPPVTRLPAEFECPLCFQVKRFMKPSDWTKHVHEDVQPFTCTFPSCGEPKSFKRKADWVRHESERHRHLESWRCDVPECWHVCYRKDNFVQHLVREHRLPEPRVKAGRAAKSNSAQQEDMVGHLVEKCRAESSKQSSEEPCRFCGSVCSSWKKLSVHLAKHMEQIGMPVLELGGHQLPRSSNLNSDARAIGQTPSTSLPLLGSRNRMSMPNYGWTTPLPADGPTISVTNTAGATGLEHAPPSMFRHRATSAAPALHSGKEGSIEQVQSFRQDTTGGFLGPSAGSSPYFPHQPQNLGQSSRALGPFPGSDALAVPDTSMMDMSDSMMMRGSFLQPQWRQSDAGPMQIQASNQWQDPSLAIRPGNAGSGVTGFQSAESMQATGSMFGFSGETNAAGARLSPDSFGRQGFQMPENMPQSPGMPEPEEPEWLARAYAGTDDGRSQELQRRRQENQRRQRSSPSKQSGGNRYS